METQRIILRQFKIKLKTYFFKLISITYCMWMNEIDPNFEEKKFPDR